MNAMLCSQDERCLLTIEMNIDMNGSHQKWSVAATVVNKQSCLGIAWGLLGVTKQLNPIRLLAVLAATQSIEGRLLGGCSV
jgi:hypothetical protein